MLASELLYVSVISGLLGRIPKEIAMNIKAIITTLALVTGVSASSAMADVRVSGSASVVLSAGVTTSSNNGVVIRDHRSPRVTPAPVYTPAQPAPIVLRNNFDYRLPKRDYGWVTLATALHDSQNLFINGRYSNVNTVMIRGLDELVTIGAITVEFTNGTKQIVRPSKRIGRGETVSLALDRNAPIKSIKVAVSGGNQGAYSVLLR